MEFPVNEPLIEATIKLKEERRVVQERIAKIDGTRADVRPAVYERVRGDYVQRLAELTDALLAQKSHVDRELATLYETRTKLASNVDTHQEQLEELKVRHSVGEFDDAAFAEKSNAVEEKLGKFSALLSAVSNNIDRYERLFSDEVDLLPDGPQAITQKSDDRKSAQDATPVASSVRHESDVDSFSPLEPLAPDEAHAAEVDTLAGHDEELHGDYFGGSVSETGGASGGSLSETRILPLHSEQTERTPIAGPRITIKKGVGAGTTFPLAKKMLIGRSDTNQIVLKDTKVSRQHAELSWVKKQCTVKDLQSSNGVFINGERVQAATLHDGDQLQIGDFILELQLT